MDVLWSMNDNGVVEATSSFEAGYNYNCRVGYSISHHLRRRRASLPHGMLEDFGRKLAQQSRTVCRR